METVHRATCHGHPDCEALPPADRNTESYLFSWLLCLSFVCPGECFKLEVQIEDSRLKNHLSGAAVPLWSNSHCRPAGLELVSVFPAPAPWGSWDCRLHLLHLVQPLAGHVCRHTWRPEGKLRCHSSGAVHLVFGLEHLTGTGVLPIGPGGLASQ